MILQHKNAVIYGAGGSLGGAVVKAFAAAGADKIARLSCKLDISFNAVGVDVIQNTPLHPAWKS